ncbi:MAG: hypothetical protein HY738_23735 [Bacteroidia bacterium]|nr:hypothetical protein [Bacteroidia bacterium]
MENLQINTKFLDGLYALNYNVQDALGEFLLLKLSAKIAEFNQECHFFEKKYNCNFQDFGKKINDRINEENFEEYDDYLAWKFAEESRTHYVNNLSSIKSSEK